MPDPARILARRLDRFAAELGVGRARARGWGIAHALAWGLTRKAIYPDLIACATLLATVR